MSRSSFEPKNFIGYIGSGTQSARQGATRYMTVVGDTPYYRSSGENSGAPGTWFPFCSITKTGLIVKAGLQMHEPFTSGKDQVIESFFKNATSDDVNFIKTTFTWEITDFLLRFKSVKELYTSLCIGDGFWSDPFPEYFESTDKDEQKTCLARFIDLIRHTATQEKIDTDIDTIKIDEVRALVATLKGTKPPEIRCVEKNGEFYTEINKFLVAHGLGEEYKTYILKWIDDEFHQFLSEFPAEKSLKLASAGAFSPSVPSPSDAAANSSQTPSAEHLAGRSIAQSIMPVTITVAELEQITDQYKTTALSAFFSNPGPELRAVKRLCLFKEPNDTITLKQIIDAVEAVSSQKNALAHRKELLANPDLRSKDKTGVSEVIRSIGRKFKEKEMAQHPQSSQGM